jgi:hypothetical protein
MNRGDLQWARRMSKLEADQPRKKTPGELFFEQFSDEEIDEVEPILLKVEQGQPLTESERAFMADVARRYGLS